MKFIVIVAGVICTLTSSAQSLSKIKQLLSTKDPVAFENYVDSVHMHFKPKAETYIWVRSILKRDISPSFHETIVDFDERVYWKDTVTKGSVNYYRVNLIATDSQFVYCVLEKQAYKSVRDRNIEQEIVDSFRNNKLIDSLRTSFLRTYGTKMEWSELFVDSNVYGKWCGEAVSKPEMRKEIDAIVSEKDSKLLTDWLKSANAEKQMYAIDGLYQLKRDGYKLTAEQQKLIDIVRSKKGYVATCACCSWSLDKISRVVTAIVEGQDAE